MERSAGLLEIEIGARCGGVRLRDEGGELRASRTGFCGGCAIMRRFGRTATSTAAWRMTALDLLEVDRYGLDEIDQKIMVTMRKNMAAGRWG